MEGLYQLAVDFERKPPYPVKPTERKIIVTAVVGMRCSDGIVICADQQVSAPDYHKYYECKIFVECGEK
ncbi:MAG: hypothetical protein ABSD45_12855 [Terriglobia bacterium]|jgi:20S proteasome alpha/beta subunit